MSALLQHIRPRLSQEPAIADSIEVTLLLEVSGRLESFAARIRTKPVIGVEAPSSLWRLLRPYRNAPKRLAGTVAQWIAGHSIDFPVFLDDITWSQMPVEPTDLLWPLETSSKEELALTDLQWAVVHLSLERSNSLFPRPFEHTVLLRDGNELLPLAARVDLLTHGFRTARTVIAPKSTTGTRHASQLDPLDALLLTALVNSCGEAVERARVPAEDGVVHSFRFRPQEWGGLWDPEIGYESFEEVSDSHVGSAKVEFVVEADVEAFYHNIPARLVGVQLERMGVHPRRAEGAARLLTSFSEVGLPVGPSASAFFAEAVLSSVDNVLLAGGSRYVRFNDDFRFFCRSEVHAQEQLALLTDALASVGLTLQSSKVRVCAASKYVEDRHASREWWLRRVGNEIAGGRVYGSSDEKHGRFSDSAVSVLFKSVDDTHEAWLKLGREAFRAIVPAKKLEVIPRLLTEIARVWALASDIAMALREGPGDDAAAPLSNTLPNSFAAGALKATNKRLLEFAFIWILDALKRGNWPGRVNLAPLLNSTPIQSEGRRELVLALAGMVEPSKLSLAGQNRWADRCKALLSRQSDAVFSGSPADKFDAALMAAITESE